MCNYRAVRQYYLEEVHCDLSGLHEELQQRLRTLW